MIFSKIKMLLYRVVFFVASTGCVLAFANTEGKSRLIIIGCPERSLVKINDSIVEHDMSGWYEIPTGNVRLQLHRSDTIIFSRSMDVIEGQDQKIVFECLLDCEQFHVNSSPPGASLVLNGENFGYTPFISYFLPLGKHEYTLEMPGYASLTDTFTINSDNILIRDITLDRSQAYKDSVKLVALRIKHSRQRVYKILFATLGGVMVGTSVYFDRLAHSYLSQADAAATAYDASRENFAVNRETYHQNRENAHGNILKRNVLLGAAGGCLLGFGLSFVF